MMLQQKMLANCSQAAPRAMPCPGVPQQTRRSAKIACRAIPREDASSQQASPEEVRTLTTSRRSLAMGTGVALSACALTPPEALANKPISSEWELVDLPVEKGVVLLDVAFTGTDPNHGTPLVIKALPGKAGQAEMTTDQGAIYTTDNAAFTWTAAVQETVDATLNRTVASGISGASYYEGYFANIARNNAGDYVAVSSRGNFYMTWQAGQTYWQPHNRPVGRRIQNMGWTEDDKVTRFKDKNTGFAVGGSGSLFKSEDGGKTWKRDKGGDEVPGNLYAVEFSGPKNGLILGNDGLLLRYIGTA
ncbi:photosynthesis system II assembly factor YCF48-domain-containing protein [Dunaliella salina]|uniref:Photosynthesis system II assembly factor YCF48-domain-containing protein n=1 Tax=Dunaliella salina TaxID=3046 RepID=A0ABQ7HAD3_DUNSA|nr:photosynthesis system II assembly factor YCF48-domain-containing protein [Dunaliella salina]|eukprot:KAF5843813.1 photosynthesis system II assembly factor YCF48-domain-containing protein [Dunaliella salina]